MKCPDCGTENLDGSVFCDDCGANLKQDSVVTENVINLLPKEEGNILKDTYEVVSLLEKGVINKYRAVDKKANKDVLILEHEFRPRPSVIDVESEEIPKVTAPLEEDPFGRIFELVKNFEHKNLIKILDYFQDKGRSYLVEEFFSTESFFDKISHEDFKPDELQVMKWGIALCNAIGYIHEHGIIHRNLQPVTILINPDMEVKIAGFERSRLKTEANIDIMVNHGFTAPEGFGIGQVSVNETSDLYSIASIIYRLLTRYKPGVDQQGPYMTFPFFKDIGVKTSYPALEKLLLKALSGTQEKRHQSALELEKDLTTVLETPPVNYIEKGAYIRIRGSMKTNVGKVREINQDSMLSMQLTMNECSQYTQPLLFIVADGMGGVADGEVASSMAIRHVSANVSKLLLDRNCSFPLDSNILASAVEYANTEIYNYSQQEQSRKGMGSTITSALLIGNRLLIAHVGDTRAYIMNSKDIRQITEDHSLIGRLLKMGQLTPEEAKNSPQKNLIYRALGTNPQVEVDSYEEKMEPGDIVLICCDGLWDYFSNEELHKLVSRSKDFDKTTAKLIDLANERGGKDNITVIIFQLVSIEAN